MIDISTMTADERLDLARRLLEWLTDDYGEEYRVEPEMVEPWKPAPLHFWEWREPNRIAISELFKLSNDMWAKQILEMSTDMNFYSCPQWQWTEEFAKDNIKIGQEIKINRTDT